MAFREGRESKDRLPLNQSARIKCYDSRPKKPAPQQEFRLMSAVVTRFAPSPTGLLHIGGVRTALFSWLYAQRHGGKFILRIEDTDRERSTEAATQVILD